MNLDENIYRFRTERNMSQGDLADALNVSRQSVSKWENNSATPELEKLLKMSELFGVTLDQLVGRTESPSPAPEMPTPVPSQRGMPAHRVLGIILLSFGLLTALLGLLAGLLLTLLGIPLITVGIVCLVCSGNLPYKCGWALFAVCAPIGYFFILNLIGYGALYSIGFFALWLIVMLLWTSIGIRKGTLGSGSRKLAIVCIAVALVLTILTTVAGSALLHRDLSHSANVELEEYVEEIE
ncbi:MAG: helix-turn-helix transcriptional regulator [Oscillospiraceae bacterium]|nr:helix-turn-helix transcriptional regulator [Oscillospiraceae bacterium]